MISTVRRNALLLVPWVPICVATLHCGARSISSRASAIVRTSGFSQ